MLKVKGQRSKVAQSVVGLFDKINTVMDRPPQCDCGKSRTTREIRKAIIFDIKKTQVYKSQKVTGVHYSF